MLLEGFIYISKGYYMLQSSNDDVFQYLKIAPVQTLMKCCILQHFIWVFTVYQTTCLRVSSIKQINKGIVVN